MQLSSELAQSNTERVMWKLIQVLGRVIKFDCKVTSGATVEIGCEKAAIMTGQRRFVYRRKSEEKPNAQMNTSQPTTVVIHDVRSNAA